MSLEAFQSGLSWLIILRKRENFRTAFAGFDIEKVARYTDADVARLMADRESSATAPRSRRPSPTRVPPPMSGRPVRVAVVVRAGAAAPARDASEVPATTPESTAMARELKRRGFRFVGPTTAYALMQATGMVDDHLRTCWVPSGSRRRLKRRRGGHVHLPARIGNNGGVNCSSMPGMAGNAAGGACPALIRSATTGQLEPGGSTRWRR